MSLTPEQHHMLVETHTILKRVDARVEDHEKRVRKLEWGLLSSVVLLFGSLGHNITTSWHKIF